MKYIIEFEDEPCMREDGLNFYKCIQAPWWGLSERVIKQLTPYQPDAPDTNVGDMISRRMAIDEIRKCRFMVDAIDKISVLPSAQSEPTQEIQDILDYLDTVLHPIVSPEHWDVYSKLHDMVSGLPSAQLDGIPLEWIDKHLEWLDNCDNDFAQLAKVSIKAMVELWKKDRI